VGAARVAECPVQLEAVLERRHTLGGAEGAAAEPRRPTEPSGIAAFEVRVVKVHAHAELVDGHHLVPSRWRPLLYVFRHYFGVGPELGHSFRSETKPAARSPADAKT
jgi:flavin reductase (DIM6/NTAB) family NADH-FMN oxidoreductase RutF